MKARTIIAAGMRRGGSTLQYQLIGDVLAAAGIDHRATWVERVGEALLEPSPGPLQLLKTHAVPECSAAAIAGSGAVVFYCSRDPRDSLVSFLRKYDRSPSPRMTRRFLSRVRDELRFWTAVPGVHWSRYEAFQDGLESEVDAIARRLGIVLEPGEASRIAKTRSLSNQKASIAAADWDRLGERRGRDLVDPGSLLHANHIHLGESGGWRQALPRDELVFAETVFADLIREAGYSLDSSPVSRAWHYARRRLAWRWREITSGKAR